MKMILAMVSVLAFIGCSPSESHLRERSFRAAAEDYLESIPRKIDFCKVLADAKFCEEQARGLRETCSNLPDIRYDKNLNFVLDNMTLIHENLSHIAKYYDLISDYGRSEETKKRECREQIESSYSAINECTKFALERLGK